MGADITNLKKENVLTVSVNAKGQLIGKLTGRIDIVCLQNVSERATGILNKIGREGKYEARLAPGAGHSFILEKSIV